MFKHLHRYTCIHACSRMYWSVEEVIKLMVSKEFTLTVNPSGNLRLEILSALLT